MSVAGVVQELGRVWLFATPWPAACQASLSFTISPSWLKFMSIELVMLNVSSLHIIVQPAISGTIFIWQIWNSVTIKQ